MSARPSLGSSLAELKANAAESPRITDCVYVDEADTLVARCEADPGAFPAHAFMAVCRYVAARDRVQAAKEQQAFALAALDVHRTALLTAMREAEPKPCATCGGSRRIPTSFQHAVTGIVPAGEGAPCPGCSR